MTFIANSQTSVSPVTLLATPSNVATPAANLNPTFDTYFAAGAIDSQIWNTCQQNQGAKRK